MIEELGMHCTTPSSMGPDGVLTTADVHGNEVTAKARGHVGEPACVGLAAIAKTRACPFVLVIALSNNPNPFFCIPETCIGRAKRFKILSSGIGHQMIPLIDQILYFCVYSANFLVETD